MYTVRAWNKIKKLLPWGSSFLNARLNQKALALRIVLLEYSFFKTSYLDIRAWGSSFLNTHSSRLLTWGSFFLKCSFFKNSYFHSLEFIFSLKFTKFLSSSYNRVSFFRIFRKFFLPLKWDPKGPIYRQNLAVVKPKKPAWQQWYRRWCGIVAASMLYGAALGVR